MSRVFSYFCAITCAFTLTSAFADTISEPQAELAEAAFPALTAEPIEDSSAAPMITPQTVVPSIVPKVAARPVVPAAPFSPFTGKIRGKKVRLRLNPDLDSHVIRELNRNDLLSVVGENGDFWSVEPPSGIKAYVFRSFVLDNVVEGNRVNVRLEPDLEAPVIGHLSAGERVNGIISALNNKWIEISPPHQTRFFIAKEFVENIGGLEIKQKLDKRKASAEKLIDAASLVAKAELVKPYEEIDIERVSHAYNSIMEEYSDLPDYVTQAKDSLTKLGESYLEKKIAFLETKSNSTVKYEEESLAEKVSAADTLLTHQESNDRMKLWEPLEEGLYLSWAHMNDDRSSDEFYEHQKLNGTLLTGIVEAYNSPVKNKPGDFILRDKDLPVGYIYSTRINLQNLVGKKVTIVGSKRPNNNFAFPAYYVLAVE